MENNNKIEVIPPQSVSEIKSQIQTIQTVMKAIMHQDEHYGRVPGCGDKMVLLKPGAEKLMSTFRIAPRLEIEDLSTSDESRYRVLSIGIYSPDGTFLGQGVGECSSNEDKFKWRGAVCSQEFDEMPENRRRKKWKKGYSGKPAYSIDQVRTDHADQANTVLKMAVKRAQVAMILTVTAASDIFVQDLEEGSQINEPSNESPKKKNEPAKTLHCVECNIEINQEVHDYSTKVLKKPLCFTHQKAFKEKMNG